LNAFIALRAAKKTAIVIDGAVEAPTDLLITIEEQSVRWRRNVMQRARRECAVARTQITKLRSASPTRKGLSLR
jgi:hypothetical protein